jgi:hypothetical protein
MKNKLVIQQKLIGLGLSLGTYDAKLDKLSKEDMLKVLDNMEYGSTDIGVTLDNNDYVVEIYHIDNEVDFNLITTREYALTYGRIFTNK